LVSPHCLILWALAFEIFLYLLVLSAGLSLSKITSYACIDQGFDYKRRCFFSSLLDLVFQSLMYHAEEICKNFDLFTNFQIEIDMVRLMNASLVGNFVEQFLVLIRLKLG